MKKEKKIAEVTTDENGKAKVSNLKLGKYYYREISAPVNVIMDKTLREFSITETNKNVVKTITNEKVKGSLKIVKVDENNNPVEGVTFEVLNSDKKVIEKITTNASGIAVSKDLTPGTYYYKEVSGPSNIIIDETVREFKVSTSGEVIEKKVVNKLAKGQIEILKVDENKTPISGVKFEILDSNKKVVDTITTDKNGKATSKALELGTYYYKEIEAPSNVVMDTAEYEFKLTSNGQIVTKTVVNKLIKGQITILKVDENKTPISGVKFEILDSNKNVVDTITTGKDGKATSKKLVNGTYYYKEIEAPSNVVMDTTEYEFKLSDNTPIITKTVVNKLVKGSIEILKVDENNTPISGVKFEILDSNKNVVDTITTDKNGKATAKNLLIGTYYYKEVSAPSNVIMDENEYKFLITAENKVITKTVVNKLVKGHLEILKVDENNTPIEGVKFQILDSDKNIVDEVITDKNGKATSKELELGTYYYKEVSAPDNYIMDSKEYKFKLTETNNVITKTVVNKLVKGSLKIIKVDENDVPLKGVKFEILDSNKNIVDTITTDKDGVAISKELEMGTYYYKEISAPDNVVIDENEYIFKLNEKNDLIVKKIVNKLATGKLQILKLDKDKNTPIEGVKFEILNENEEVIEEIITDKDGIAISKELKVGTYFFREVDAPDGYIMDSNVYKFKITKNNQVIEKTIYNEKEKLPVTGGILSTDMIIVIAVAIISIIGYSIYSILSIKKQD